MLAQSSTNESKGNDGFYDSALGVNVVSVMMGENNWSRSSDIAFATTLGSCMSVCVCDKAIGIGGMNHFLLPEAPEGEDENTFSHSFRYGSAAIETLLNMLYQHGAARNSLSIKIFGGGRVLKGVSGDVGLRNIDFTRRFFKREHMRIEKEDVGGTCGRRVIFFPTTGRVLLRTIGEDDKLENLIEQEGNVLQKLKTEEMESDIELF